MPEALSEGFRFFKADAKGLVVRKELKHGEFEFALVPYKPA